MKLGMCLIRRIPRVLFMSVVVAGLMFTLAGCSAVRLAEPDTGTREDWVSNTGAPPKHWQAAVLFVSGFTLRARTRPDEYVWKLVLHVTDGDRSWTLTERDFNTELIATPRTPWYRTRETGSLRIDVVLLPHSPAADTVRGYVVLPLKTDQAWTVFVDVDSLRPCTSPFGCQGAVAFPVRTRTGGVLPDSLWISWGASPIRIRPVT
jgi:hypothetical protein